MFWNDPITYIGNQIKKIRPSVRWTFAMTILVGILVHFYSMSHKFFNYFEMGNIFSKMPFLQEDTVALGRWFMPIATNLFTSFSMPVWNTLISLFYMAVASALIVDLLQIRSRVYGVLFGLCFVTFPGFTCVLSYGVNCDEITLALLLAVLAAYLFFKVRYGIIRGMILLCLSLASYQPYMSLTIGVIYMMLFMKAYREKLEWKPFLILIGRSVLMLAAGFLLYYALLQAMVAGLGITLSDYHGVDSMTSFTPKGIAKGLVYSYGYFLAYFFSTEYIYTIGRIVINVIGGIAFLGLLIRRTREQKVEGSKVSVLWMWVLLCFLPLGCNSAPFLMADRVGSGVDRYMIFSLMFLWALLLAMLDDLRAETGGEPQETREGQQVCVGTAGKSGWNLTQWTGCFAVVTAILTGVIIDNQAYHRMEAMTETTGSLLNRIAARMEEQPEWNKDIPVYFVNCRALVNLNYDVDIPEYDAIRNMPGTFLRSSYSEEAIVKYMEVYLHFPVKEASEEERRRVEENPLFDRMESYPSESSVQVIDGVMVVKISDGEEIIE
ncbi:MAG: glucosyltransferase domain-containing protein [Lachnospiraceae bacterium]|nr:glucosyltransferase domain-containing protein [Lachnospiraceae bacterium]